MTELHDYYVTIREAQTYKVRASDETTAEGLVLENRIATPEMQEIIGIDVERSRWSFRESEIDWIEED